MQLKVQAGRGGVRSLAWGVASLACLGDWALHERMMA